MLMVFANPYYYHSREIHSAKRKCKLEEETWKLRPDKMAATIK